MNGWIKLYRKITENPIFDDPFLFKLWVWCLMKATHKETTVIVDRQQIHLKPGQFVTGRKSCWQEFNKNAKPSHFVSERTLWNWIKKLEEWGYLAINSTNKYSLITIVKWAFYQGEDDDFASESANNLPTDCQQVASNLPTDCQQFATNKNVKNEKNVKNKKNDKEVYIPAKVKYAEFVSMTEDEYNKLIQQYGEDLTKRMIDVLDNYKGASGKKYKSDYRAILNWVVDRVTKEQRRERNGTHIQSVQTVHGRVGQPTPGPSQETLRLERLAREKGLIRDGEIPDIDVDF
jgi:hypothetical protein